MYAACADRDRDRFGRADRAGGRGESATSTRVLCVDDDECATSALVKLLRIEGFTASTAPDGEAALAEVRRAVPDVVLADLQMPRMDGVELCRLLHAIDGDLPVIVMTAHTATQSMIESLRGRAEDFLIKPLEFDAVLWCVKRATARRTAKREQDEVLDDLAEGVAIADDSGRIVMINATARAILGVGEEELSTIDALHSLEALDLGGRPLRSEQRPLMRALRGEQFRNYEVLRVRPNGERRRVVSTGTSVRDVDGSVALATLVFHDVTELR